LSPDVGATGRSPAFADKRNANIIIESYLVGAGFEPARLQAASDGSVIGILKWREPLNFRCRYLDFTTVALSKKQEYFGFIVDSFVE
jgi:hypothetical protein